MDRFFTHIDRFRREESGVALVEFAIFLPLFLLSFFVIVEFSRIFFSYQNAISGVRDASRYLARVADTNVCVTNPPTPNNGVVIVSGSRLIARRIIRQEMRNERNVLPSNVSLSNVSVLFRCVVEPGNYRQEQVPIVRVAARINIILPLGGVLELNGEPLLPQIRPFIIDESRVFGV